MSKPQGGPSRKEQEELLVAHQQELERAAKLLKEFDSCFALRNYQKAYTCLDHVNKIVGQLAKDEELSPPQQVTRNDIFIEYLKKSQKLAITLENWEMAVQFCEHLNKFDPEDFEYFYTTALCYLKVNNLTQSQAYLEKAVAKVKEEPQDAQGRHDRELMISTLRESLIAPKPKERELFYSNDSVGSLLPADVPTEPPKPATIGKGRVFAGLLLGVGAGFGLYYGLTDEKFATLLKKHDALGGALERLEKVKATLPDSNKIGAAVATATFVSGNIWASSLWQHLAYSTLGVAGVFAAFTLSK